MIVDTSFIIDFMNGQERAIAKARVLEERGDIFVVTTPTIFELWSGLARSSKPEEEKRKLFTILNEQVVWDFNRGSAEEAGTIEGSLIKKGLTIDPEDCMIAGIAKSNGETLLTGNPKHFIRIEGLIVDTY